MGAIALTAKKLWGNAVKSPPQEFCCHFLNSKITQMYSKKYEFIIMSVTKVAQISA